MSTLIIEPNGETMLVDTGHYNDAVERARIGSGGSVAVTDGGDDTGGSGDSDGETVSDLNGTLAIATINADAEGDDRENLNDEYVVFENAGTETLDLSGGPSKTRSGNAIRCRTA